MTFVTAFSRKTFWVLIQNSLCCVALMFPLFVCMMFNGVLHILADYRYFLRKRSIVTEIGIQCFEIECFNAIVLKRS